MRVLTEEQVRSIPELVDKAGGSVGPVAEELKVTKGTINRWAKILKGRGVRVNTKRGPKPTLQ